MNKRELREIEDIIFDLECEARKNSTVFLIKGDNASYMYWRGQRAALSDLSIKIGEIIKGNE